MNTLARPVADRSLRGTLGSKNNTNAACEPTRLEVLVLMLAVVGALIIGTPVEAKAQIKIPQLNGRWQIALLGTHAARPQCDSQGI